MQEKSKIKVVDYEKSVASAFIAGGIFIGIVVLIFIVLFSVFDFTGARTAPVPLLVVVLIASLVATGVGVFRNIAFSKKYEEFDMMKRTGKKLSGKITNVKNGLNIDYGNRSGYSNENTIIIAECTVTDEETGSETVYYSRKIMCIGNIIGMKADVYVFSSGQYYVDTDNLRVSSSSGATKVHDFR